MKKTTVRIKKTEKITFVFPVKSVAGNIHSPSTGGILHCD
jgi:hypothetical protein